MGIDGRKSNIDSRRPCLRGLRFIVSLAVIVISTRAVAQPSTDPCGPKFLLSEGDGGTLLVLCEKGDLILRVDSSTGAVLKEVATPEDPFAACMHPDGLRVYVTCRRGQQIVELDAESLETIRTFPLRGDPTGIAVSGDGRRLYAGVHSLDQVAVFDLNSGVETARLSAGNGPEIIRLDQRSGRIFVTNLLSNPIANNEPCRNEITIIDSRTGRVVERTILEGANVGRGIDFTKDGSLGIAAISRPKNLVPMVQVARGWVVTNGFVVFSPQGDADPVQLLVDLPNQAYSDPHDVVITPNAEKFYLSCGGADSIIAVDMKRLSGVLEDVRAGRIPRFSDHLGLSRRYVSARIAVGANPQALAINESGSRLFVANRLDDSISVIETVSDRVVDTFALRDALQSDRIAEGERLFHNADRVFQDQFCCASCHPDSGFDGLQYDLEPDGLGENLLDNRNLRGVAGTAPFKWVGSNPDITTQCGTRTAKWIVRTGWISSTQVVNLAAFIRSIKSVRNPYRTSDDELTPAQRRGKTLFERTKMNDGTPIAERDRCDFCHAGEKFFDGRQFDVGTKAARDTKDKFDTAHLINIFESAPYLHDGRAATLEEIWTVYNPDDLHGISRDWTKRQLNDLVEFLMSL